MSSSAIDTFNSLGLATTSNSQSSTSQTKALGQEQFLKLLTTQLTHQDPSNPMENGEFLGQMAQFATVSGIQDLQASFKQFADTINSGQVLQASGLVGRYVLAPTDQGVLSAGGTVSGNFELPNSSTQVNLKIVNPQTGATVREIELGDLASGKHDFSWDGLDEDGQLANPGVYNIQVQALIDGKNTQLSTNVKSLVESVTMGSGSSGLQVNLSGLGSVKFNQIKQIL